MGLSLLNSQFGAELLIECLAAAVHEILPKLNSLGLKLELIRIVGHGEHDGHELVTDAAAQRLLRSRRDEVCSGSDESLVNESDLLRCLVVAKREADASEPALTETGVTPRVEVGAPYSADRLLRLTHVPTPGTGAISTGSCG